MSSLPKYESRVIFSSTVAVGTFAGSAITLPAGTYYLTQASTGLLATLKGLLDAGPGGVWTLTCDDDSDTTATGKITIARNSNYTATWTSTAFRNLLGFSADLSTASTSSFQGDKSSSLVWLPNCGRSNIMSNQAGTGAIETDYTLARGSDGTPYSLAYSMRGVDTMEHRTVLGNKAWTDYETTTNESFETFYRQAIPSGLRLRFFADRATDTTYRDWAVEDGGHYNAVPVREDHHGAKAIFSISYRVCEVPA